MKRTHRLLARIAFAGTLGVATPAFAQAPALAQAPAPTPLEKDPSPLSGFAFSAPIRLSLMAAVPQQDRLLKLQCESHEDAAGNSVGGIPLQYTSERRLARGLFFTGFSRLGCPIDGGVGGALTYAMPVRESISLAFNGGLFLSPGQLSMFGGGLAALSSVTSAAARVDVVFHGSHGRLYNVGIMALSRFGPRVSFGGLF